ncbi:MAG: dienelactone hydrolase family protein [Candidatus Altimarinota bacterium]
MKKISSAFFITVFSASILAGCNQNNLATSQPESSINNTNNMNETNTSTSPNPNAKIKSEIIEYQDGDQILEGYLAYDENLTGKRPGVLVIHEWTGLDDYAKTRTNQLAELGYVAFAADIYGKGVRPEAGPDAAAQSTKYKTDRQLYRSRLNAGLNELKKNSLVDTTKLAAIGYCFGGTGALELARSGADILGAVSFHGGLDSPTPEDGKNIKGKILVLHGAEDTTMTQQNIDDFQKELDDAKISWQMVTYSGAVHGFSNPNKPAAYNADADRHSWQDMQQFFQEIF